MREVLHHVADEETILLPMAEDTLAAVLRRLSARMNTRRVRLIASRPAELAVNTAGAFPVLTLSLEGAAAFALVSVLRSRARKGRYLQ